MNVLPCFVGRLIGRFRFGRRSALIYPPIGELGMRTQKQSTAELAVYAVAAKALRRVQIIVAARKRREAKARAEREGGASRAK